MEVRYVNQPQFEGGLSIFLAGPSPKREKDPSWRPKAVKILKKLGFKGTVLVPEFETWTEEWDYHQQIDWELTGLKACSVLVFWVPRKMKRMPGLTTNVEFGMWIVSTPEKVVYGRPKGAIETGYLDYIYGKATNREPHKTLKATLRAAVEQASAASA